MKTQNKKMALKKRGQGMTEYIIIVALIAIATIGIITLFGDNIRRLFSMSADALAGASDIANSNSIGAGTNMEKKKMLDFAKNNAY